MPARGGLSARALAPLLGAGGAAALMVLLATLPAGGAAHVPSGGSPVPLVHPASRCAGNPFDPYVNGTLAEVGNSTPVPSAVGVNLTLQYDLETAVTPKGGSTSYQCSGTSALVRTGAGGDFALHVLLPSDFCTALSCTSYAGPYPPDVFSLPGGAPPGYFLNGSPAWPVTHLRLVAALDHLAIDPPGPKTLSVEAPTAFSAVPTTAIGTPSPATLGYLWSISGDGWSLNGSASSTATVVARAGAAPAELSVRASGQYAGHSLAPMSFGVGLSAVATSIAIGSVDPTALDNGSPARFTLTGSGAEGYAYAATVFPGLGAAAVPLPCTATLASAGTVEVSCAATFPYTSVGEAQPVATLTNNFSGALWHFPTITVAPGLGISADPTPLLGYAGSPLALRVSVAPGTGTAPFGPACIEDGLGGTDCATGAGPAWSFTLTYPNPGSFSATVRLPDGSGTNGSLPLPVTIGTAPVLGPLAAATAVPEAGTADQLSAALSGGVGPFAYWWNLSSPAGTFAHGSTARAGTLSTGFVGAVAGWQTVTLTVVDRLGTRLSSSAGVYVLPGPAVALAAGAAGPNTTWVAGAPTAMSFVALAPDGSRVPQFSEPLEIGASGPGAPALALDSSLLGPVRPLGELFPLPANAWYGGYLNLTLTEPLAGALALRFTDALPVAFAPEGSLSVEVAPAVGSLRLVDPLVAEAGTRANETLWHLVDPYGNAAPAGVLFITESYGGSNQTVTIPIRSNGTSSWTWINYSVPDPQAGVVVVRSEWGQLLLGPIDVPGAATVLTPYLLGGLGAAAAVVGALYLLRRRRTAPARSSSGEVDPEDLRLYALGREALLERIRREGPLEFDALLAGGDAPPPQRAELGEWLASLLTEGLVRTVEGPDGSVRFEAAPPRGAPAPMRVDLDPEALARALARRDPAESPGEEAERRPP